MSWSYLTYCVLNFKDISSTFLVFLLNGYIFVVSPSIRRRSSTWKVRGNYIDFERRIHVEIMTSSRRGYFNVDSTSKINEISRSSLELLELYPLGILQQCKEMGITINLIFFKIALTEIIMQIFITKNNTYLFQNNINQSF